MIATFVQILTLAAFATQFAAASPALVTVPIPLEDVAVTAQILGVDSQGRTTYVLQEPSTPLETATIVAASDYVSFTVSYQDATTTDIGGLECKLVAGNYVCVGAGGSAAATATIPPQAMASLVLDVVSSLPPASSATPSASVSAPSSIPSGGASPKTSASIFGALMGLLLGAQLV
ncbi:hypothetical protein DFH09DRAFT_1182829 [Mycena vulgaris]|nr:hypothetical protein DFH09DRAFT_1182829 [Mycena vulgaris]